MGMVLSTLCGVLESKEPFDPSELDVLCEQAITNGWVQVMVALVSHPNLPDSADERLRGVNHRAVRVAWLTRPGRPVEVAVSELSRMRNDEVLSKVVAASRDPLLLEKLAPLCRGKRSLIELVLNTCAPLSARSAALVELLSRPGKLPRESAIEWALRSDRGLLRAVFAVRPYTRFARLFTLLEPDDLAGLDGAGLMRELVLDQRSRWDRDVMVLYSGRLLCRAFPSLPETAEFLSGLGQVSASLAVKQAVSWSEKRAGDIISEILSEAELSTETSSDALADMSVSGLMGFLVKPPSSSAQVAEIAERFAELFCAGEGSQQVRQVLQHQGFGYRVAAALTRRQGVPNEVVVAALEVAPRELTVGLICSAADPLDVAATVLKMPAVASRVDVSKLVEWLGTDVVSVVPVQRLATRVPSKAHAAMIRFLVDRVGAERLVLVDQLAEGSSLTFGEVAELAAVSAE